MTEISRETLTKFINYNESTGSFLWAVNRGSIKAGSKAGAVNGGGYLVIGINYKLYSAHRLAWLYVHGVWPKNFIDHINGVKTDNRISNLREATIRENGQNRIEHRTGKLVGATYAKDRNMWRAQIEINNKNVRLGQFKTEQEAHKAYVDAKNRMTK